MCKNQKYASPGVFQYSEWMHPTQNLDIIVGVVSLSSSNDLECLSLHHHFQLTRGDQLPTTETQHNNTHINQVTTG